MVKIQKGAVIDYVQRELGLQTSEGLPLKVSEIVQPVIEVAKKYCGVCRTIRDTANGTTAYIVPVNHKLYVTAMSLNNTNDAACDCTDIYVAAVMPDGTSVQLMRMGLQTTTAGTQGRTISFPVPLVLGGNQSISMNNAKTAGTHAVDFQMVGYLVEDV